MLPSSSLSSSVIGDQLNSEEWTEAMGWVTRGMRLSRPIRNPERDFSDGALVAEIVAHHLPRYVFSPNSFPRVHSLALKKYNWEMLERVVLRNLGIRLSSSDIDALANAEEGAIQAFLPLLRANINDAITQRRFRPSSASKGLSRSTSKGGSQLHLDKIGKDGGKQQQQPLGVRSNGGSGGGTDRPKVLDGELDKGQLVEKLYAKVRAQEAQLRKKDEQIEALSRKVEKLLELVCEESAKRRNGTNKSNNNNSWEKEELTNGDFD